MIQKFFPNNDAPLDKDSAVLKAAKDDRALFWGKGRTLDILTVNDMKDFKKGFSTTKFVALHSDGKAGTDTKFTDADFFFFRSAEAYLTYAEATARLNNGRTTTEGTDCINQLRTRANVKTFMRSYTLREILDERSREFYFEGLRRTDLIRYGYFGGNNTYMWSWKGGVVDGRPFESYRNIFPLPTTEISVGGGVLKQNPDY